MNWFSLSNALHTVVLANAASIDIGLGTLALAYLLLLIPLGLCLWLKIPIIKSGLISIIRMTVQLLLVGFYLQVVFDLNRIWLTSLWLIVMVTVADLSIVRSCGLRLRRFMMPVFLSLLIGTILPLLFFVGVLLGRENLLDAQYVIPIGGMILGNCLRSNIIGLKDFYETIRKDERHYQLVLAQGAQLHEAAMPYLRKACENALLPMIGTMATIGLVSLPGMMTGVILGGSDPMTAIQYQIAIMISIFSSTAISIVLVILISMRQSFHPYGMLRRDLFT